MIKNIKAMKKGKVTIKIEVDYEWLKETGDGIYEPKEGDYYDFDVPSDEYLRGLINEAIRVDTDTDI